MPASRLPGARTALALLLAINLFNYIDRYVLAAVLLKIGEQFGKGKGETGLLMSAFLISYTLVAPLFGWLGDRTSRWKLIALGVVVWSLASGGTGLATTFAAMLLTRALIGVGEAAYGPVAPSLISDLFPVERRGEFWPGSTWRSRSGARWASRWEGSWPIRSDGDGPFTSSCRRA